MHQVLTEMDLWDPDPVLGSVDAADLIPGANEITLRAPYHIPSWSETRLLLELACLAHVVKETQARSIFEFGTFIGRTTRLLALNSPEGARICTLDLPQERVAHQIGKDYQGTPEAAKIEQLHGDTMTFDPERWLKACDFVWVDAGHDYPFVKADTENAIKMCRPGGWIGWHDYRSSRRWEGVNRYVREIHHRFNTMRHIRGTTIVLAQMPG
jgi:predicted O-methyltransferase YrrM